MMIVEYIKLVLNFIRCIPHMIVFFTHKNRHIVRKDINRWLEIMHNLPIKLIYRYPSLGFLYLMSFFPEYRNLFYYRIGNTALFLNRLCRQSASLMIGSREIEEGLFIRHGFASAIGAKSIGKNCLIHQQVTITGGVIIEDNVTINAGAVLIGDCRIGQNSVIGANTTVYNDVPRDSIVLPSSPRILRRSSNAINQK